MRRAGKFLLAVLLGSTLAVASASPASAATARGCQARATSFDEDGRRLDTLRAPGPGGTHENPFRVDPLGTVRWRGTADSPIRSGHWRVEADTTPAIGFGGSGGLDRKSGTARLARDLTVDLPLAGRTRILTGRFATRVVVQGGGGRCAVRAVVEVIGSPLRTPVFYGAALLVVAGLVLAVSSMPEPARRDPDTRDDRS